MVSISVVVTCFVAVVCLSALVVSISLVTASGIVEISGTVDSFCKVDRSSFVDVIEFIVLFPGGIVDDLICTAVIASLVTTGKLVHSYVVTFSSDEVKSGKSVTNGCL